MTGEIGLGAFISAPYEKEKPFLQQIPREAADFFILKSQIREFDKGDIILEASTEGEYFYVLQSGQIQVCGEKLPSGQTTEVAILEKGTCFGEMSIICDEPTSNTVIALTDCTVLLLSRNDFIRFISDNPSILVLLYKVISDRLRAKNRLFDEIGKTTLMGSLESLPFVDLAQSIEKSHGTATVFFSRHREDGFIAFREGKIYCAKCGSLMGADALEALLTWQSDTFFRMDPNVLPDQANINVNASTTSIILDALRNIDEKQLKH